MEGQLTEHPLAELISEILEKRFSGALRVDRERVKAVVYFEAGELTYATSNLRSFRLAEYLKKRGLPSNTIAAEDSPSDFAIAKALLAKGVLTQPVLDEIISEQVVDLVRVLLLWTSGSWSFEARARLTEPIQVRMQIKQLLLDAARRMDLQFASSRFRHPGELISPVTDSVNRLNLSSTEGFLLSRVAGPIEVDELVAVSGLREPDARRTIYGLVLASVLKREGWPFAFRTTERGEAAISQKTASPKSSASQSANSNEKSEPARDPQEEMKEFLDQLSRATNHYEVLNVSASADAGEVKIAYYSLARRFHPDRFHDLARTPLHARLESAFARITQAHETLSDPGLRSAYDLKIEALKGVTASFSVTPPDLSVTSGADQVKEPGNGSDDLKLAERRFQEGVAALKLSQTNVAISCLSAAAQLAPTEARYHAYYGCALATLPKTQRMAEAEFQTAIKLDPASASYRVMLAGLYRNLGFTHRAIAELERALSLDSQNAEAQQMLQTLK